MSGTEIARQGRAGLQEDMLLPWLRRNVGHPITSLRLLGARADGTVVDEEIASCNARDYAGYTEMMRLLHRNDAGLPRMCARPSSYMVACPGITADPRSGVMPDLVKP